jgi:hypothetical protein
MFRLLRLLGGLSVTTDMGTGAPLDALWSPTIDRSR